MTKDGPFILLPVTFDNNSNFWLFHNNVSRSKEETFDAFYTISQNFLVAEWYYTAEIVIEEKKQIFCFYYTIRIFKIFEIYSYLFKEKDSKLHKKIIRDIKEMK